MAIHINGIEVETFTFPGGEVNVKVFPQGAFDTSILAKLNNSDDVIKLIMTVDAVRNVAPDTNIHLSIPYFPYARQDRVCNEGEALGLLSPVFLNGSLISQSSLYSIRSRLAESFESL
jgi:ribose-phosphate pyrophosphokinase